MKVLRTLLTIGLLLTVLGTWAQTQKINITGRIEGLEKGDTLVFEYTNLPKWDTKEAFRVVISKDNEFRYQGTQDHTQLYLMRYHPIGAAVDPSEKLGLSFIVGEKPVHISGTRRNIYHSSLSGGDYDKQLASILQLEDSLGIARSEVLRKIDIAREAKDQKASAQYGNEFNNFQRINAAHFSRLRAMEAAYCASNSSEYVASELCQQSFKPLEFLQTGYDRLTPEVQKSYYGTLLNSIIAKILSLQPGQTAPDFQLTTIDGKKIGLSDFRGKYLMIYNFGLCPGSMAIDSRVSELHNKYGNKVEVIGMTDSKKDIEALYESTSVGDSLMGMDLHVILKGMTSHPWRYEVLNKVSENEFFGDLYSVQGLPYFIFISPEGKIVDRGFTEVVGKAYDVIAGDQK